MTEKYLNIDINDPRADKIGEILANKTCKKILDLLAEKEMSASEISQELSLPLNTAGYNLEKLVSVGLIEKTNRIFWSSKGKKIESYRISNKKIIISPKKLFKNSLPIVLLSGLAALIIKFFFGKKIIRNSNKDFIEQPMLKSVADNISPYSEMATSAARDAPDFASNMVTQGQDSGSILYQNLVNFGYSSIWFLTGALIGLVIILFLNWEKINFYRKMKGGENEQ